MDKVTLPKGTVVKLNGVPCELAEDTEVKSPTLAGTGLDAFLRGPEEGSGEGQDEWPTLLAD